MYFRAVTKLDVSQSTTYTLKMAEAQKAMKMKHFVEEPCKKKGAASHISPYLGKQILIN